MAKAIEKQFKITAPGGQATPAPPLGPALGANGINPGQFIQAFNDRTKDLNGKVVGCLITVYQDRSFDFEIKSSPAASLLREAAGIEKGIGGEFHAFVKCYFDFAFRKFRCCGIEYYRVTITFRYTDGYRIGRITAFCPAEWCNYR